MFGHFSCWWAIISLDSVCIKSWGLLNPVTDTLYMINYGNRRRLGYNSRLHWLSCGSKTTSPDNESQVYLNVEIQYIPKNMHTVFALLCFVVVIHWLIFLYPSGLLHWHCDNLTIAPVPAKQPWWIWINTSCEFIMNDCITTTKQSTTKPCACFLVYTVVDQLQSWPN